MLKIYHNPQCSKCRETLQLIKDADTDVNVIEYLKTPPSEEELREILINLRLPVDYIIRKKEKLYLTNFKGKILTDDEWIKILVANPTLIERPIVINESGEAILGRPPRNVSKLL